MCYDMSFFSTIQQASKFLKIPDSGISFQPTYHQVAQSFCQWPVVIQETVPAIRIFEWGVIADYMNTPEKIKDYRTSMANARSEKILDDARSVWHRIRRQRCLVLTTGFFEHHDTGAKKKTPYFIRHREQPLLLLAGLYNYSPLPNPETGELVGTFSIITRPANSLMATIHNGGPNSGRMPLILDRERAFQWINPSITDTNIREIIQYEWPSSELEAWPVNTIRTRKEDSEAVIERV
jgi:putative SOS response-associated peptidase YedK